MNRLSQGFRTWEAHTYPKCMGVTPPPGASPTFSGKLSLRYECGFHVFFSFFALDMSDDNDRQEFLDEIQLMKAVGVHRNIVNMVGCCTVEEPMFLLVEYAPYGDLLHYLRKHRKKVLIFLLF